jgi:hypothetical protein
MIAATVGGGVAAWYSATSQIWPEGGVPVRVSLAGHIIFWAIGAIVGFLSGIALVLLNARAPNGQNWWLVAAAAMPVGSVVGAFVFFALSITLITIPHELFDVLTA